MSVILELPRDLEAELSEEARRAGLSLSEYILHLLATARPTTSTLASGDELVAYWQAEGLIGTRSDIADSQAHARHLRRIAETRERE